MSLMAGVFGAMVVGVFLVRLFRTALRFLGLH